ncbi:AraC family transcriptional regulator [Bordetella sp. BOR01]|uniref:AraC family transcriptional regulator n=1 Tax=Bordetella sp. BOR01 TaxID=2854779 RepID=UPI001C437FC8|nr:AraC family transcriptional regulator [Bordetella sp. BOR01]
MYGKSEKFEDYENASAPVSAMAAAWAAGTRRTSSGRNRARLLIVLSGVLAVRTQADVWLLAGDSALWLPAGVDAELSARAGSRIVTVFISRGRSRPLRAEPCRVTLSALLRELVLALAEAPLKAPRVPRLDRITRLVVDEIRLLPAPAINLPWPRSAGLRYLCEHVLEDPAQAPATQDAARHAGMSLRTFGRRMTAETGVSYAVWLRQAKVLHALTLMARGESMFAAAVESGFADASTFCTTFKRIADTTPRAFFSRSASPWGSDESMYS